MGKARGNRVGTRDRRRSSRLNFGSPTSALSNNRKSLNRSQSNGPAVSQGLTTAQTQALMRPLSQRLSALEGKLDQVLAMLDSQFNVGPQAAAVTTGNANGTGLSAWDKKNHRRGPSSVRRKSLKLLVKKAVSDARDKNGGASSAAAESDSTTSAAGSGDLSRKSAKKKRPKRAGPQHRASMPSLGSSALMPEGW